MHCIARALAPLVVSALGAFAGPGAAQSLQPPAVARPSPPLAVTPPIAGTLDVVTYNVAGLPEGLSAVHPLHTLPLVGAALSRFDLVLVQEDYAYPELLRSRLTLPFRSAAFRRGEQLHFGDGLSLFSKLRLGKPRRAAWRVCHGVFDAFFDCLTPKGLAMARLELGPGAVIDVYDVHLDAGAAEGDIAARAVQLEQLFTTISAWSGHRSVVLGGDFNLTSAERGSLRKIAAAHGFRDACDALRCPEPWRLDRILFRDGASVRLKAVRWQAERGFRDASGAQLSDHLPVRVTLHWRSSAD
jgi:endonuclease/exonuclease/phosphatase family metal-dependent hydrolase